MDFRVERHANGAVFHLTRAARMNALIKATWAGLTECLDELEQGAARFLVITAEGDKAFCAGTDLAESKTATREQSDAKNDMARAFLFRLSRSPVFTVAAINGLAYGGGLELAMACTVRIAVAQARMSLPEVKLGVLPTYGGTQWAVSLVGRAHAADLMLTGRAVTAQEALAMGLINRIADPSEPLLAQALGYAQLVASYSPVAVDGIRRCLEAAGPVVTEAGLAVEGQVARHVLQSEDAREGVAAFLEKRTPAFKGR